MTTRENKLRHKQTVQLEWIPLPQLESSLLHVATRLGQACISLLERICPLQLTRKFHHNSKRTPNHLLQLKRHPEFPAAI